MNILKNYMQQNHLTKKLLAQKCDISLYSLNKLLSGNKKIKITTVIKVAITLNIKIDELIGCERK